MLNYIIMCIIPLMILLIIIIAIKEKKDVFKLFTQGALDGLKTVYNISPYILAITIAIGLLRNTGALDILLYPLKPILIKLRRYYPVMYYEATLWWSINVCCYGYI